MLNASVTRELSMDEILQKIERSMMACWTANRMFFDPPRKKQ